MTFSPSANRNSILQAVAFLALLGAVATLFVGNSAVSARGVAPVAPDRPNGEGVFRGGVDLEWNEVAGAESYAVQLYRNSRWIDLPGDGVDIAFYGAGAIISGLDHRGAAYYFRVRANNAHGSSDWSEYVLMARTSEHPLGNRDRPGNIPAAGAPTISGSPRAGETLTADTSGIHDENGLDRVKFHYQWTSKGGAAAENIKGATGAAYTLTGAEGGDVGVLVSFTDRGGYAENLSSAGAEAETVESPPNTPATGALTISGRPELYQQVSAPEHMAYIKWKWSQEYQSGFREMEVDFTIHNDVGDFYAIYLTMGTGYISDALFYLGLQTDVWDPNTRAWREKGLIFSRWDTRDLAMTRVPEGSWTQSSGHEGDFVGVRRQYDWGPGNYRLRVGPDGADPDGEWFGLWITDVDAGTTTWIGSLKFPYLEGTALIEPYTYSNIEIYGRSTIRPIEIPEIGISVKSPTGDGVRANIGKMGYSLFYGEIPNSEVRYEYETATAHLKAGGLTRRETQHCDRWVSLADTGAAAAPCPSEPSPESGIPGEGTDAAVAPRVGETLTAHTSGIADADGLDNAAFTFEWLADDMAIAGATGSTYKTMAVDAGRRISVRVSFNDDAGNEETLTSPATEPVETLDPPARPSRPTATVTSDTVTLTWTDPGDDTITGYKILRRSVDAATYGDGQGAPEFVEIGSTGPATGYVDSSVSPRTKYVYRIVAVHVEGDSKPSGYVYAETLPAPRQSELTAEFRAAPERHDGSSAFTVELHLSEEVAIGWRDLRVSVFRVKGGTVTGARRLSAGSNMGWEVTLAPSSDAAVGIVLTPKESCDVPGALCTEDGRGLAADLRVTVPGPVDPPSQPSRPSASATDSAVTLSWNAVDGATNYKVLRRSVDGATYGDGRGAPEFVEVGSTADAATEYVDTSVSARTKYIYRVVAVNAAGDSPRSRYRNVETPEAVETDHPPAQPSKPSASATASAVTLTWSDPGDETITGYRILRRSVDGATYGDGQGAPEFVEVGSTVDAATEYVDTTVEARRKYVYRVVAVNAAGDSPRSRYRNVETPVAVDAPARPTGLSAEATGASVTLSWDDPGDDLVTHYRILRRSVDGDAYGDGQGAPEFVEVAITADAATEYVDTSVTARTKYVYRVVAVNAAGDSERSRYLNVETPPAPDS